MCSCFFFGQFRMYYYILMRTLSCLPSPLPTPVHPSPEVFPHPCHFVLFCDPLGLMGLELTLAPTGLTTEDSDRPSSGVLQSSREGRGRESSPHTCALSSRWSPERESFVPCWSKVLQTGDHVPVCTLSLRCPVCRPGIFCCT